LQSDERRRIIGLVSYRKIHNLYREQTILLFRECYAMEKIHGTSAHIRYQKVGDKLHFYAGGESHEKFVALFDQPTLLAAFQAMGHVEVTVYGEAYGGKQQKQTWRYGPALRFVAFEVQVGETWLDVPSAENVVQKLGLEFVHYARVSTDLAALDAERDAPSVQGKRNGVDGDKPREGVVLRPVIEVRLNGGERVMAKHKRAEERETATPREVVDPSKLQVLADAEAIAIEWCTPTRLEHLLQKIPGPIDITRTREVIAAMVADVLVEGEKEIVDSREARAAIGTRTAKLFKVHLEAEARERAKEMGAA
jgi:hypothetical protein